jgi:hypothetical protein
MNRKEIEVLWVRAARQLRAARATLYSALSGEWLAKLQLNSHYAAGRAAKQPRT